MTSGEDRYSQEIQRMVDSYDSMDLESIEKRVNLIEDLQKIEKQVNQILDDSWERETRWGDTWWDVENMYKGETGTVSIKGRANEQVTVQYRADYMEGIPPQIDEQVEYLNQEIALATDQVSQIKNETTGMFMNIDLNQETQDPTTEQRYLKDAVALMASADRLIPDTQEIVPYGERPEES